MLQMRCLTRTSPRTQVVSHAGNNGVSISPISRKSQRRDSQKVSKQQSSGAMSTNDMSGSQEILEAFFYGRAFAITLSKRLGEVVVDAVAEISKAAAERPQKIQEFQDEVAALARKEMEASSVSPRALAGQSSSSTNANDTSLAGSSTRPGMGGPADLEAVVDDLRAEIAYSRAVLQQIKTGGKSGAVPGPPPAIPSSSSSNGTN